AADTLVPLGPQRLAASRPVALRRIAGRAVIRVGGGMDGRDPSAAPDEVEQRLTAGRRRRLIARIVEEAACGVVEEDGVVLLQIRGVDVRRLVRRRRGPGAGLRAERLDRFRGERNRRVDPAGGPRQDEHLPRRERPCRRLVWQRRHHLVDVALTRRAWIGAAAAARRALLWGALRR